VPIVGVEAAAAAHRIGANGEHERRGSIGLRRGLSR
jgi:hypothetical protein